MTQVQANRSAITLKGSADLVCDYLNYGMNSILYQRGLYPAETFTPAENYGLTILMSTDNKIKEFITSVLSQLKEWLIKRTVKKIALVIVNVKTLEVMERWDFDFQYEGDVSDGETQTSDKPLKKIQSEIRDVLRQIASSIAYLPLLECLCSFDVQFYMREDVEVPENWVETKAADIENAQSVKMRSFSTGIHMCETNVIYKNCD